MVDRRQVSRVAGLVEGEIATVLLKVRGRPFQFCSLLKAYNLLIIFVAITPVEVTIHDSGDDTSASVLLW